MKHFEVNYLSKGQKAKTIIKSPNRRDAIAIAKVKIPGIILTVKETSMPLEEQLSELKVKLFGRIFRKKSNFFAFK